MATPEGFRSVTKEEFFSQVGPLNVHPSIINGTYPYQMDWNTPARITKAKSIDYYPKNSRLTKTKWYLLKK